MANRFFNLLALSALGLLIAPASDLQGQHWADHYDLNRLSELGHQVSTTDIPAAVPERRFRIYLPAGTYDHAMDRLVVLLGEWDLEHEAPSLSAGDTLTVILGSLGRSRPFPATFTVTATAAVRPDQGVCQGCPLSGLVGWAYHLAFSGDFEAEVGARVDDDVLWNLSPATAFPAGGDVRPLDYDAPDAVVEAVLDRHLTQIEEDAERMGLALSDPHPAAILDWKHRRLSDPEVARIARVRGPAGPLWAAILGAADDPGDKGTGTQILYLVSEDGRSVSRGTVPSSNIVAVGDVTGNGIDEIVLGPAYVYWDGTNWTVSEPVRGYITH